MGDIDILSILLEVIDLFLFPDDISRNNLARLLEFGRQVTYYKGRAKFPYELP